MIKLLTPMNSILHPRYSMISIRSCWFIQTARFLTAASSPQPSKLRQTERDLNQPFTFKCQGALGAIFCCSWSIILASLELILVTNYLLDTLVPACKF